MPDAAAAANVPNKKPMTPGSTIYIAGHTGLAGSAIVRQLQKDPQLKLLLATSRELDLRNQPAVDEFFARHRPAYVFLAAAKVGGILANSTAPAEFLYDNLAIQTNVIHSAWKHGAQKLLFLGSSCIYPKFAPQPIREESLLTSALEPTNEAYAIAKIAGLKMAEAYRKQYGFSAISLMPTNLYGPGDNFHPETSHVLPAMIRRFHEARMSSAPEVIVWGTGTPRREFLHVDDLASAACFAMEHYNEPQPINVGTGEDVSIADLASLVARITGFAGRVGFDPSRPDGTPRKLLDVSRLSQLGWRARIALEEGIASTYMWYREMGVHRLSTAAIH